MPAPNPPRHRLPDAAGIDDLDARIRQAEEDLIERDQRVRHQVASLGQRVRRAQRPARWVMPIAGGVLLLAGAWWLWRKRPGSGPARPQRGHGEGEALGARPPRRPAGMGVFQLLALAWPLLPEPWRARWGPTSTSALFNLGGSLARGVMARAGMPAGAVPGATQASAWPALQTEAHVDLGRYAGTWHEIARLPTPFERPCAGQPQATYTLHAGGIDVCNRCRTADGQLRVAEGEARVVPGSGGARLKVSFLPPWLRWLPVGWGDYWILFIDEAYTVALVGEPSRRHLWVLARRPRLAPDALRQLVALAGAQGFPVERLLLSQPR
jgi:apolipoprotein D and lipocalin family protein